MKMSHLKKSALVQINCDPQYIVCVRKINSKFYTTYGMEKYICTRAIWSLHHSDRGAQYASEEYRTRLVQYHMQASMSHKGNCYDNACIESFHSILKKEFIYCTKFGTKAQAQQEVFEYIEFFYNRKRIHGSLGYLSPDQYEELYYKNIG